MLKTFLLALASAGLFISLWILVADVARLANPILLPAFKDVVHAFSTSLKNGELQTNLGMTLFRVVCGLGLGILVGVCGGVLIGSSDSLYRFFEFPVEFLRALPATAMFPFFLILFGLGEQSKVALIALPTSLLMLLNTYYGIRYAQTERKRMALVFGASAPQLFFRVVFFEALPQMAIGLRLSLSFALVLAIASEMFIGTESGIGQRIFDAYLTSNSPVVYSYVSMAGCIGFVLNKTAIAAERHFIFWVGK